LAGGIASVQRSSGVTSFNFFLLPSSIFSGFCRPKQSPEAEDSVPKKRRSPTEILISLKAGVNRAEQCGRSSRRPRNSIKKEAAGFRPRLRRNDEGARLP
jgi:hypothetical protein